jgi:hypothetical protein
MTGPGTTRHVEIDDGGQLVAAADVESLDRPGVVRASLHVEPGHLPSGTRTRLVDAVLDLPEVRDGEHLEAAMPLGDAELLERMRARCDEVQTRAAGASCLVNADLPPDAGPPPAPAAG